MLLPLRSAVHRSFQHCRRLSLSAVRCSGGKGLILGVYEKNKEDDRLVFTQAGDRFDGLVSGKLRDQLTRSGPSLKKGKLRIFYGLHEEYPRVVVVGLGKESSGFNQHEQWNERKENIRTAAAVGCRQLQDLEVERVEVDVCGDGQAAAEGAILGLFEYDELKKKKKKPVTIMPYERYLNNCEQFQKVLCWQMEKLSSTDLIYAPLLVPLLLPVMR